MGSTDDRQTALKQAVQSAAKYLTMSVADITVLFSAAPTDHNPEWSYGTKSIFTNAYTASNFKNYIEKSLTEKIKENGSVIVTGLEDPLMQDALEKAGITQSWQESIPALIYEMQVYLNSTQPPSLEFYWNYQLEIDADAVIKITQTRLGYWRD